MATPLAPWQNFWVIVGSGAAALIAVQFVVITLVVAMRRRTSAETIHAFATPTVVHLSMALFISALMGAPWSSLGSASAALAIAACGGLAYGAVAVRRTRRQTGYRPDFEDWLWYGIFPLAAYAALAVGAFVLASATRGAEFAIGGAALALLFIGIHNAWDAVTHMVTHHDDRNDPPAA